MTSLLAHHSHQPIDSAISDLNSPPSPQPYHDFALFADTIDTDDSQPSAYLPPPLDLSVLGAIRDFGWESSRQSTPYERPFSAASDLGSMQGALSPDPRVRVQQTSFNTASSPATPPPMSEGGNWAAPDQTYLSPTVSTHPYQHHSHRGHKRLSSESSVASTGPDSPYSQPAANPHIVDPDAQSSPFLDFSDPALHFASGQVDKSAYAAHQLQHAPNPISFVNPAFQNLNLSENHGQGVIGGQASSAMAANPPRFDRTMSDAYQDALYDPSQSASAPVAAHGQHRQQQQQQSQLAYQQQFFPASHRSVFNDRLQQADTARSLTPLTDNSSRDLSPFTDNSEYANASHGQMPRSSGTSRFNPGTASTVAGIREQQKMQEDARVYAQHVNNLNTNLGQASKTISPKEALLDPPALGSKARGAKFQQPQVENNSQHAPTPASAYAAHPLFAKAGGASVNRMTDANSLTTHHHELSPARPSSSYPQQSQQPPTFPSPSPSTTATPTHYNSFMPSQNVSSLGTTANYPFISNARRQSSSLRSEQSDIPQFPASLTSMESTKSESSREPNVRPPAFRTSETASSSRSELSSPRPRPLDTSANSGSYTCTAANCNARFDSAARLHKHRKDSHPSPQASASPQTSNSSAPRTPNPQAVLNNQSRNNAPGPHRCDKINPTTGRPCGTQFSRSYDLTRHDETIHSGNKKKVRCPHCNEEKLFSRNDALTRHMRVVHPDIDYPATKKAGRR